MSIKNKMMNDLKTAMRSRDSARKTVLRYLRSEIHNREIDAGEELDDEKVTAVLGRQAQQRRDSIEMFNQGNRPDLVDKEEAELAIILEYLPEQLPHDEIVRLANDAIIEIGILGPEGMGQVMAKIMPQVQGKAEGRKVSQIVSRLLENLDV